MDRREDESEPHSGNHQQAQVKPGREQAQYERHSVNIMGNKKQKSNNWLKRRDEKDKIQRSWPI